MWGQLGWGHIYQDNDGQVQILGGGLHLLKCFMIATIEHKIFELTSCCFRIVYIYSSISLHRLCHDCQAWAWGYQ